MVVVVVVVVVVGGCFRRGLTKTPCVMSTRCYEVNWQTRCQVTWESDSRRLQHPLQALDDEELFTIEGSENWRSTPDNRRSAKNDAKCVKKPITATTKTAMLKVKSPSLLHNWNVPLSPLRDHRDVRTVDELHEDIDHGHLSLHTTSVRTTGSRKTGCNCGISTVSTRACTRTAGPAQPRRPPYQ